MVICPYCKSSNIRFIKDITSERFDSDVVNIYKCDDCGKEIKEYDDDDE